MQRAWTIARKEDSRLAYLVATARHCFKCKNVFSMKWRILYNSWVMTMSRGSCARVRLGEISLQITGIGTVFS